MRAVLINPHVSRTDGPLGATQRVVSHSAWLVQRNVLECCSCATREVISNSNLAIFKLNDNEKILSFENSTSRRQRLLHLRSLAIFTNRTSH